MARATRLFGFGLVLLGIAALLYSAALVGWQAVTRLLTGEWIALPARLLVDPTWHADPRLAALARLVPSFDWPWANHPTVLLGVHKFADVLLDRAHLGVYAALAGWALVAAGRAIAARQADIIAWHEQQRTDRRRRIAQYATS